MILWHFLIDSLVTLPGNYMCELTIKRENGLYPDPLYTAQIEYIVSVLHQNEGGIGKSIRDAQEISRDPRDFPKAKPEGNLEG